MAPPKGKQGTESKGRKKKDKGPTQSKLNADGKTWHKVLGSDMKIRFEWR